MNNLEKISSIEEYNQAILNKSILVFSTAWCPDCHFLKTYIDKLVADNLEWKFYYVDRDEMTDLCIDLDIMGIPSFIIYNKGNELSRLVNKLRKTQVEVQAFIDAVEG